MSSENREENSENVLKERLNRLPLSEWSSHHSDIYDKEEQVGEGVFGKVFKAKYKFSQKSNVKSNTKLGEYVALKKILMHNEKEGFPITAYREIMLLNKLKHKNIVGLHEVVTSKPCEKNKYKGSVYLVFEYMEHDINGLIDRNICFEIPHIKCILFQILTGINYLHQSNVIHRDIKGANILLNNSGEVKIADFGLARAHTPNSNQLYTNRVVTLWYRAPEILLGSQRYDTSSDMWSVGCLFSELLCGVAPFRGIKEQDQCERIFEKCGTPTEETFPGVTTLKFYNQYCPRTKYTRKFRSFYLDNKKYNIALDLLEKMLEMNPKKRISAKDALLHKYFEADPKMCEPKDLPKVERESHEYQSKMNKRKLKHQKEMIIANNSYHRNDKKNDISENSNLIIKEENDNNFVSHNFLKHKRMQNDREKEDVNNPSLK